VRVVLDTAVIVAATRSDAGASRQLVLAALEKRFELLLSVPLVFECGSLKEASAARGVARDIAGD
jgi:predicted nucleic acid-binding protein